MHIIIYLIDYLIFPDNERFNKIKFKLICRIFIHLITLHLHQIVDRFVICLQIDAILLLLATDANQLPT